MMRVQELPLIVGVPGTVLTDAEAAVLEHVRPSGIILFSRNIESADQVRTLVHDIQNLEPEPFVCIDLEGGDVNRLASLWGSLPSPAAAAARGTGAVRALGVAAGAACRALGIHLDLAPVVDLETGDGLLARQERCLNHKPERVVELANAFADGLETWQVSGCLKHFPGLGSVPVDTHQSLPELDLDTEEIQRHLSPFEELAGRIPMVMIAHAITPALGDGTRPASLDPGVIEKAASLGGTPVIVSDDLEMGAVAGLGDLADLTIAALDARNHGVIISRSFDQLEAIAARLAEHAAADHRFANRLERATARMGTLRRELVRKLAAVPEPSDETVSQLWGTARLKVESS